jgi:hypothetical protein
MTNNIPLIIIVKSVDGGELISVFVPLLGCDVNVSVGDGEKMVGAFVFEELGELHVTLKYHHHDAKTTIIHWINNPVCTTSIGATLQTQHAS